MDGRGSVARHHRAVVGVLRVVIECLLPCCSHYHVIIERSPPCCGSSSSVYCHVALTTMSSSSGHHHVEGRHRAVTTMLRVVIECLLPCCPHYHVVIECLLPCCGSSSSVYCHVVGRHRVSTAMLHLSPHRHRVSTSHHAPSSSLAVWGRFPVATRCRQAVGT